MCLSLYRCWDINPKVGFCPRRIYRMVGNRHVNQWFYDSDSKIGMQYRDHPARWTSAHSVKEAEGQAMKLAGMSGMASWRGCLS